MEHPSDTTTKPSNGGLTPPGTAIVGNQRVKASEVGLGESRNVAAKAPGAPIDPVFNERFLFDDELETADDSAYLRKYNLSADDDDFPVLRQDQFPSAVRILCC